MSHAFQRSIGRTNFFLAGLAVLGMTVGCMVRVYNYFIPVLGHRSLGIDLIVNSIVAIILTEIFYICMQLDEEWLSRSEILPSVQSLSHYENVHVAARLCVFCVVTFRTIVYGCSEFIGYMYSNPEGVFFFRFLEYQFAPALLSFLYFIIVFPLPPGKSKVREWIKSFSAGFLQQKEVRMR